MNVKKFYCSLTRVKDSEYYLLIARAIRLAAVVDNKHELSLVRLERLSCM
jgi:hypothetical protein